MDTFQKQMKHAPMSKKTVVLQTLVNAHAQQNRTQSTSEKIFKIFPLDGENHIASGFLWGQLNF